MAARSAIEPRGAVASLAAFFFIFTAILLLHLPLLRLPYFWDEAGYYIPAARDFFLHHQLIPTSTLSNAHPPLPSVFLAFAWWIFGYAPIVTRIAMLVVAAAALVAVFRIAETLAHRTVAFATVACTALYPIWFVQSSLAHADLLAASFTLWALACYFRERRGAAVVLFCLAALSKETALIFPLTLIAVEIATSRSRSLRRRITAPLVLLLPLIPLAAWFGYHFLHTGFVFGNPEFLRYNVSANASPLRFLLAFAQRLWQLFGHMDMFVLTIFALIAMTWQPLRSGSVRKPAEAERPRIAIAAQLTIASIALANLVAFSLLGGALLTRYMLPVFPLIILIFVSTLWRRWIFWRIAVAVVIAAFLFALVRGPRYRYAPEDNLAYADYVRLHEDAAHFIAAHLPHASVLTAWTGTEELNKPWLGYVPQSIKTVQIEDFSADQIMLAAQDSGAYDAAFVFSTKYDPGSPLERFRFWEKHNRQFFGYHRDLPPQAIARLLGGKVVWSEHRGVQWAAVIIFPRSMNG